MRVYVHPYHYRGEAIDTTSRSKTWSRELSPFYLGPVKLWGKHISQNVENGWQFSKVYEGQTGREWLKWAKAGWASKRAERYPMGKGSKPLFLFWDGEKLPYIEARKKVYCPLYANAVEKTEAYDKLKELFKYGDLHLRDFDGYNHYELGMSFEDVLNCETRKSGHAFVLAMMLMNERVWEY